MTSKLVPILGLLAILVALPAARNAQATGTIHGAAFDSSGAVVPDVSVTATNVNTNQSRKVKADSIGQYTIPLLPVGNSSVRIEKKGFAPFLQSGVKLQVSTDVEVNARLE